VTQHDGNKTSIAIAVVGTLLLIISGWAGNRIIDHEARLTELEITYGEVKVLLKEIHRTNNEAHNMLMHRLDRIEDRLEDMH
jgi:hypothetical protein